MVTTLHLADLAGSANQLASIYFWLGVAFSRVSLSVLFPFEPTRSIKHEHYVSPRLTHANLADYAIRMTHSTGTFGSDGRECFTSRLVDSLVVGGTDNAGNPGSQD